MTEIIPAAEAGLGEPGRPMARHPALRLHRPGSPAAGLGLAVGYLMTKPAFAALKFGAWSRVLVGQINRGHYHLVLADRGRVVGFLGWALTDEANAEAWVRGGGTFSDAGAGAGDCVVFNAWAADDGAVNRFVLHAAREVMRGRRMVYFKRHYPDGGTRPARMGVNAFVASHIARATGRAMAPASIPTEQAPGPIRRAREGEGADAAP